MISESLYGRHVSISIGTVHIEFGIDVVSVCSLASCGPEMVRGYKSLAIFLVLHSF